MRHDRLARRAASAVFQVFQDRPTTPLQRRANASFHGLDVASRVHALPFLGYLALPPCFERYQG